MTEVEADQSGKIEDFNVDTVLAYSNGSTRAIRIPVSVKRAGLRFLRQRRLSRKTLYLRLLVTGLCLLLRDDLDELAYITVDVEFAGRENDLRGMLLSLIRRTVPDCSKDRLVFRRIGKQSPAHCVALATYRGERAPEKTVTESEFVDALK